MPLGKTVSQLLTASLAAKGKRLNKRYAPPKIPAAEPVFMKNPHGDFFNVGYGNAVVMPENLHKTVYWMAGYNIANKIKGVMDPLTVSAMWIDCDDGQGIVLVSCDFVGLTGYDVQDIRGQMRGFCQKTGCKYIMISCTHTHAGIDTVGYWGTLPKSGKNKEYMLMVKGAIKAVCFAAYQNRKKGSLFFGNLGAPELLRDGREPIFFNDKLSRLRFVPDDGSPETWYLNFGAHPNTLGRENSLISADYPCYMRNRICEEKKVNVLFSVGAIGSMDLAEVVTDRRARTVQGGRALGEKALAIQNDRKLMPRISFLAQHFSLPVDNPVHALMCDLGAISARKIPCNNSLGIALLSEMTYLSVDDLHILALPGECFSELVWQGGYSSAETSATGVGAQVCPKTFSQIAGDENLVIFGVTNDMTGYIIPPNDFILHPQMPYIKTTNDRLNRHHYNETNSVGPDTARVMAKVFEAMTETLRNAEKGEQTK